MFRAITQRMPRVALLAMTGGLLLAAFGCDIDRLLEVDNPQLVTAQQLSGPGAIPTLVAGVVGNFQTSYGGSVWETALLTDELLNSGTHVFKDAIDRRQNTMDLPSENWGPIQIARQSAEDALALLEGSVGDPRFESVAAHLEEGIVLASFYAGFQHVLMAESFCEMVIEPTGPVATPAEALQKGIALLQAAESRAGGIGRTNIATAARIGQARANLQLGNYSEAASLLAGVPDRFLFVSRYSSNSTEQWNRIYQITFGDGAIHGSVGDGTQANRRFERWPYFDEWVEQGLVDPNPIPRRVAFESSVRVQLQKLHDKRESSIHMASGWEARMIEAEVLLRNGQVEEAEALVNRLLASDDQSVNPMSMLNGDLNLRAFRPVSFTGDLREDLPQMARARAAGLWLSTDRQATLRRYKVLDGVDLYPPLDPGDGHCFPIPRAEQLANPNVPG